MSALLNPVNRMKGGIKWGLAIHTAAMFSFVTIYTAINLNIQSISFINNREFPGTSTDGAIPPGPIGYQWFIRYKAITIALGPFFVMNNWLADGLLVSLTNPVIQGPALIDPLALSLLHCLRKEPLGHHLPIYNVSRLFWYVLEPFANRLQYLRLTPLIQRPASRTCTRCQDQNQLSLAWTP